MITIEEHPLDVATGNLCAEYGMPIEWARAKKLAASAIAAYLDEEKLMAGKLRTGALALIDGEERMLIESVMRLATTENTQLSQCQIDRLQCALRKMRGTP